MISLRKARVSSAHHPQVSEQTNTAKISELFLTFSDKRPFEAEGKLGYHNTVLLNKKPTRIASDSRNPNSDQIEPSPSPENVPRYSLVSLRRVMMPTSAGFCIPSAHNRVNQPLANRYPFDSSSHVGTGSHEIVRVSDSLPSDGTNQNCRHLITSNLSHSVSKPNIHSLPTNHDSASPSHLRYSKFAPTKPAPLIKLPQPPGDQVDIGHRNTFDLLISGDSLPAITLFKVTLDLDISIGVTSNKN